MATLRAQDRLQPALLDRLTDDDPSARTETADARVINRNRLRELVLRDLGIFARYSQWDNQAGGGGDTQFSEWDVGFNYWLEEHVVLKVDYQFQDAPDNQQELEGLNLGVGWSY